MEEKKMGIHVIEGKVVGQEMKVGIVAARFNEFIVSKLLSGAVDGLVRHGGRRRCDYCGLGSGGFRDSAYG